MYLLTVLTAFAFLVTMVAWGRWVVRRRSEPIFRAAAYGVLVGPCIAAGAAYYALTKLSGSLYAPPAPEGSAPADEFARQISGAISDVAVPVGLGNLIFVASVVALAVGTMRARREPRP